MGKHDGITNLLQNGLRGLVKRLRKREINRQREVKAERVKNRRTSEIIQISKIYLGMKDLASVAIVSIHCSV